MTPQWQLRDVLALWVDHSSPAQPEPSCDRLVSVVTQLAASGLLLRVSLDGAQLEVTQRG